MDKNTRPPPPEAVVDDTLPVHGTRHSGWPLTREDSGGPLPGAETIGRYTVLSQIGAGSMGIVYRAYDPDLDRKVAVKLLPASASDAERRDRLLREARALAQISHPNVIAVHDVGSTDNAVFLAMELVEGQTLTAWLKARPRQDRIVAVFAEAARGLHAAHTAGFIHRDFKPDNVMIGDDGRVRVLDFGLARAGAPLPTTAPRDRAGTDPGLISSPSARLTQTGAVVGTPAYMSPEQFAGLGADARSDLFAFAVALYEALVGERPFAGTTPSEVATAVTHGQMRPIPAGLPSWLRSLLRTALAPSPDDRFPDMAAIICELERDRGRTTRRVLVGLVLVAMVAAVAIPRWLAQPGETICAHVPAQLDGAWTPARQASVRAALVATDHPLADAVFARLREGIDAYAREWAAMWRSTCEATHLRGEQSAELLDLRMHCLDEIKTAVEVLGDELSRAESSAVLRSLSAPHQLPPVQGCADTEALRARQPPRSPEALAAYPAITRSLARARTLRQLGDTKGAKTLVLGIVRQAEELAWLPLQATALLLLGDLEDRDGNTDKGLDLIESAAVMATAANAPRVAAEAYTSLTWFYGYAKRDLEMALRVARLAQAFIESSGRSKEMLGDLRHYQALALQYGDKPDDARRHYDEALALLDRAAVPNPDKLALVLNDLGTLERRQKRYEAARGHLGRALEIRERLYGLQHPFTISTLINLANVDTVAEAYSSSAEIMTRALVAARAVYDDDHPRIALIHYSLGEIYEKLGKLATSVEHLDRAIAIYQARLGPAHVDTLDARRLLAGVYKKQQRPDEARAQLDQGIAALRASETPDPDELAKLESARRDLAGAARDQR